MDVKYLSIIAQKDVPNAVKVCLINRKRSHIFLGMVFFRVIFDVSRHYILLKCMQNVHLISVAHKIS